MVFKTGALLRLTGCVCALGGAAILFREASAEDSGPAIRVLSNRADLVSGGDVRVVVDLPAGADPAQARLDLDGRDVTAQFALRPNGRYEGIVSGLSDGVNQLSVHLPGGKGARIAITSHPLHGPVFSGPQVLPWICDTEAAGLGPSTSPYCEVAAPVYTYVYKPKSCAPIPFPSIDTGGVETNCLLPAYDPASPPTDVDTVTTDQGKTVPFIVRIETGVIDRGIYKIAALYDPTKPDYQPWAPQDGYNGKVLMTFGGDCTPRHGQGQPISVQDVPALARGFAVMTSNLNILGQNCNDVVNAESLMMLKEYFIEHYGDIRYVIGNGASGGSIQQQIIAADYPGLLDGIQPAASFPDFWQVVYEAQDCHLVDNVFYNLSPQLWAVVQQQAFATGYAAPATCKALFDDPAGQFEYSRISFDPAYASNCNGGFVPVLVGSAVIVDPASIYNAQTNPGGIRCTLQDYGVAIWGRRDSDGFANRAFDNVGVQYGLQALESGQIMTEQFIDLNEKVGGLDIDWNYQPQRSVADAEALRVAYRGGRTNSGKVDIPVIDLRGFSPAEIHTDVHSYSMRERLIQARGNHDNQIIWTGAIPLFPDPTSFSSSFLLMDQWLSAIEADTRNEVLAQKVVQDKPGQAVDACWIAGQKVLDMAVCRTAFPYFGTPRIAAGGPLADNVLKCQLKPLKREDYHTSFSDAQWARLQAAFPDGVCDYSKPGIGSEPQIPWLTYENGPGGQPLGPAPVSAVLAGADGSGSSVSSVEHQRFGGVLGLMLLLPLAATALRRRN